MPTGWLKQFKRGGREMAGEEFAYRSAMELIDGIFERGSFRRLR